MQRRKEGKPEYRTKWGDRHFWAREYYVSTVGNVNEEMILKSS
nr:transposase [uncultured Acetatifactor sp.]